MFVVLVMMIHHYQRLTLKWHQKPLGVFNTKTIKIRNDFEQWCDVQGIEQTGGSDNEQALSYHIIIYKKIMTLSRIILILFH